MQGYCALTQSFYTKKSGEISVFYGVRTTGAVSLGPWQTFMIEIFIFTKMFFNTTLFSKANENFNKARK